MLFWEGIDDYKYFWGPNGLFDRCDVFDKVVDSKFVFQNKNIHSKKYLFFDKKLEKKLEINYLKKLIF